MNKHPHDNTLYAALEALNFYAYNGPDRIAKDAGAIARETIEEIRTESVNERRSKAATNHPHTGDGLPVFCNATYYFPDDSGRVRECQSVHIRASGNVSIVWKDDDGRERGELWPDFTLYSTREAAEHAKR